MRDRPTDEQLAKLPKYVSKYIEGLERERDRALAVMRKMESEQVPTKVKCEDFESTGEQYGPSRVTRYFDAKRLEITQHGVTLCVDGLWNDDEDIILSWRPAGQGHPCGDIALIPLSHQRIKLSNLAYNPRELDSLVKQKGYHEREGT